MFRSPFPRVPAIIGFAFLFASLTYAQTNFDSERDVRLTASVQPAEVPSCGTGELIVELDLPQDVHITSLDWGFFFVKPDEVGGVTWGEAVFPPGVDYEGETVYRGLLRISVPLALSAELPSGTMLDLSGTVGYQVCTEVDPIFCTPPVERDFNASLIVVAGDRGESLTVEDRVKRALERGSLIALIWIFIGGMLLSFTPCVYPVIPITIAYIGAHSGGSRFKGFTLSLVFVLGLAIVYSALGLIAAATGGVFGLSTQNPWVIGFVTIIFLVMGAGMLGAFDINLPAGLQTKLSSGKRTGYAGALLVGGTTGLVAAPCVGPVLVALLSWVSSTGSLFLGFIYLFVFACGLGLLFVVIGTFAGVVTALPKAGGWMEKIKHGFGIILVAAAFYFGKALVPENLFTLAVGLALLMLAGLWGGFSRLEPEASLGRKIGRGIAFFVLIIGAFCVLLGLAKIEKINLSGNTAVVDSEMSGAVQAKKAHSEYKVNWIWDDQEMAFERARASGNTVMIDFWADWCAACKELDHKTFSQPEVYEIVNRDFISLKIDGSNITDDVKATWNRYGVKGLPTVLFIAPDGEELERFEAFRTAEQMLPILERVKK